MGIVEKSDETEKTEEEQDIGRVAELFALIISL